MTNKKALRPTDEVELKLGMMEASRRKLKALAAEAGCSMSDYVEAWVSSEWKRSSTFQRRMKEDGVWWTDDELKRHRPDGSLADEPVSKHDEGGSR